MPTVQTNDVETYYECLGSGPPVVFVHGALVDHAQWAPQAEALADEYTVVSYDVRGHGRTGGSAVADYSVDLFADDLHALVAALDLDSPVVCGLSLGGCIAQVYATDHPDRLSGLVLADTFTPSEWGWAERVRFALLLATIPPARLVGFERAERAMVWLQERLQGTEVSGDYARIEALRAESPPIPTGEFEKVVRSLGRFRHATVDLSRAAVPRLVLFGEHEAGFIKRHSAVLAGVETATLLAVPDAAHASNLDNPAFVTRSLRAFLRDRVFGGEPVADPPWA